MQRSMVFQPGKASHDTKIACMIFLSGTFSLVLHQRFIFEASMFWGWIGFYVLSIILLGKTLQLYLKKEKMIGELIWNLQ